MISRPNMLPRVALLTALAAAALLLLAGPAAAAVSPAPRLSVESRAFPTDIHPGGESTITVLLTNVGHHPTNGSPITFSDTLPAGLAVKSYFGRWVTRNVNADFPCENTAATVTCTTQAEPLPDDSTEGLEMQIRVAAATEPGILTNTAHASGGGSPAVESSESIAVNAAEPPFGFAGPVLGSAYDPSGAPEIQAAGHPSSYTAGFVINSTPPHKTNEIASAGLPRDASVLLPAGFIGNPRAAETCPEYLVAPPNNGVGCPESSVVGWVAYHFHKANWSFSVPLSTGGGVIRPIFNVAPPHGYPAEFAFIFSNQEVQLLASLVHTPAGYAVRTTASTIVPPAQLTGVHTTFFGDPSQKDGGPAGRPFLTNPSDCSHGPFETAVSIDSWENPGTYTPEGSPNLSDPNWLTAEAQSPPVSGCESLQFHPTLSLLPDTTQPDSPAGINVDLHIPQEEEPEQPATPPLKNATVTLPKGMAVDPSSADGLQGCSVAQIAPDSTLPGNCPLASQLGEVEAQTPIFTHPLPGKVYLGDPECAPCSGSDAQAGKLIKLFIEVNDPVTGIVVKELGSASANPTTGQITATFKENPQVPIEDLKLSFKTGQRAPLTTPPTCGTYTTNSALEPWSAPETETALSPSTFKIKTGCAATEAAMPNTPAFTAGTLTPAAGAYSPFVLKLSREDGSQRIKGLNVTLPPGLTGKLAGVGECSAAQIEAAEHSSGAAEKANPSCPLNTEVGTVNVGAGSGAPFYVQGHAYLAGPYKGAPLSMAIITPAVAGPFDLGTVVVKAALYVNPETAQITVKSDPIPTILAGIPLDVRSIAVDISRNQFTINPTSCDPMSLTATAIGLSSEAALSSPFQVGGCGALGFAPKLALSLKGTTHRAGHPALKAVVTYPTKGAYANIARAQVNLPHSEFLDNAHIGTICTKPVFAEGAKLGEKCPAASIYGFAKAETPLLDHPVEGPVYLRSPLPGHKLPDLVAALNGQIDVALVGKVDTGPNHGIRNTFEVVPDAPVTRFTLTMQGGSKGLLENSENICKKPQHAIVAFTAQNGKVDDFSPLIANSCKTKKHKKRHRGRR